MTTWQTTEQSVELPLYAEAWARSENFGKLGSMRDLKLRVRGPGETNDMQGEVFTVTVTELPAAPAKDPETETRWPLSKSATTITPTVRREPAQPSLHLQTSHPISLQASDSCSSPSEPALRYNNIPSYSISSTPPLRRSPALPALRSLDSITSGESLPSYNLQSSTDCSHRTTITSMSELDRDTSTRDNSVQKAKNFSRPFSAPVALRRFESEQCPRQTSGPERQQAQLFQQPVSVTGASSNAQFEIRILPLDGSQGNRHLENSSVLQHLSPFTFERVQSGTGQLLSNKRYSAPSPLSIAANETAIHERVSMDARAQSDEKDLGSVEMNTSGRATIVHDRAQRIKSWITELPAEDFVDPETSLPTPTPLSDKHTTSTSQEEDKANNLPHYPFLDSPPMEPPLPNVAMSRFDHGHQGHFDPMDRTPIRGNFIPISKSVKVRSPSPQRPRDSPHVVQLSLTDSQMDRLTSVLSENGDIPATRGRSIPHSQSSNHLNGRPLPQSASSNQVSREHNPNRSPVLRNTEADTKAAAETPSSRTRSRSPVKFWGSKKESGPTPSRERSRSPVKFWSNSKSQSSRHVAYDLDNTPQTVTKQPAHRQVVDNLPSAMASPPSTFRRAEKELLQRTETHTSDQCAPASPTQLRRRSREPNLAQASAVASPLSPKIAAAMADYAPSELSVSIYSDSSEVEFDTTGISVNPLSVKKDDDKNQRAPKNISVLQDYAQWMNSPCVQEPDSDGSNIERLQAARGSDRALTNNNSSLNGTEPQYSALSPFTSGLYPMGQTRIASKTLIGHNGWLESTTADEKPRPVPEKKQGFFDNLVRKAKGMMVEKDAETQGQRRSRDSDKSQQGKSRSLAVSLNPREQSLLYCELEYTLATALNDYIAAEFEAGRLEADKLKKIQERWQQLGRPKVKSFRYDLETQLELVKLHVNHFKFYGTTVQPMAILGVIDMMTVNARVLRIRTFCQPDTVIAKQLLDSQSLFNTIGAPENQQIQLSEITHFFKAAVEREKLYNERRQHNAQMRRSKSTPGSKEKWQHQSTSTHNHSSSHNQSYVTHTSKTPSFGTQHLSHGTQHTLPTQSSHHHSHGTQASQSLNYGTNKQVHRAKSRVRINDMDPAHHGTDEGF
ncbi:hypothetical protein V8F20_001191 [Naviculisporaceae sp. PSN 640]